MIAKMTSRITVSIGLTPELSRAERDGWEPVLLAYQQVSTKQRHGVGLNDLLGGRGVAERQIFRATGELGTAERRSLDA